MSAAHAAGYGRRRYPSRVSEFATYVENVVRPYPGTGRKRDSASLLHDYYAIITNVAGGYNDYVAEYFNDLAPRDFIEQVLRDPTAQRFPEFEEFVRQVDDLDEQFRRLLTPTPVAPGKGWWTTHLPLRAGRRFNDEMWTLFDYRAEPAEDGGGTWY
ncbi:hypothetical protein AXZ95_3167 [Leifsonia sp. 115AMFTsu3.1]|nr:hypothetical protein AXZ95_3167 [Leifsonia sp. 115AMFTsu3.1]